MMDDIIIKKIEEARANGKTIGLVQGSWDMFHLGHLKYLQEARKTCDFLIVAMDDDEKIKHRKGEKRPIIPLDERYQMIDRLNIADAIVVKSLGEPHWGLIKTVHPDVLIAIKENYKDEEIKELEGNYCERVAILPRQATTSTSNIIRRTLIANGVKLPNEYDLRVMEAIENFKRRVGASENLEEPLPELIKMMEKSTDWVTPVAVCGKINDKKWVFGVNQIDQTLPDKEIENRTELFYGTVEHAEINFLKQLKEDDVITGPIYATLFPCDKCMKVLIDKGVKEIRYIEDHPERNWSKRSHELATKKGVVTKQILLNEPTLTEGTIGSFVLKQDLSSYKYIDPRNVRFKKQLEIMLEKESLSKDPLDISEVDQEVLYSTNHWYVSKNRFPYEGIEHQFLIVSLNPIYNIKDMSLEMWDELGIIWNDLIEKFNIRGGALCYRFGDTLYSGASLKRLHAHLIVPKESYKAKFNIGGNPEVNVLKLK